MASFTGGAASLKNAVTQTAAWQKHGKGIKTMLNEWVGPLAIATGMALKFFVGLKAVLVTSQLIGRSLEAWSKVQYYTPSFAKMLGGMDQAKARLRDLVKMSASGPFKFDSLVKANQRMQILTRGARAGKEAMKQVADAAAAANISPEAAGEAYANMYQSIENHQGIDEAAKSLGELGIISVDAADNLRNLAAAGASDQTMLTAFDKALSRNNGAAKELGNTLMGLSERIQNVASKNLGDIGSLFSEGSAAGMRAALMMLEAYGPVLVDLMKPLAAFYNTWNKIMEALAKFATMSGIVKVVKMLAAAFAVLASTLAIKGIQILIVGLVDLAGLLLTKIIPALAGSAGGAAVFRGAMVLMVRAIWAALGPIGVLALALGTIAELWDQFDGSGGDFGKAIGDTAKEIKDANDKIADVVKSADGKDVTATMGATQAAKEALETAKKAREIADKKSLGGTGSGYAKSIAGGAAMGAIVGSSIPIIGTAVGAGVGAAGGGISYYMSHRGDEANKKKLAEEEKRAEENYIKSLKNKAQTPSEFIHNPDYEAARQESIRTNSTEPMSKENLDRRFNARMAQMGSQSTILRATANGDQSKLFGSDLLDANMKREARQKELAPIVGGEKAFQMSKAEGLASLSESLLQRGNTFASSRASVGGAVGEAAGGVPPEFQKVIDEIKKCQTELSGGNANDQQVAVREMLNN